MLFRRLCLLSVVSTCVGLHASMIDASNFTSGWTTINFDNVPGGSCSLCGPSITTQYSSQGVVFDNPSMPGDETADTNLVFGIPNASPNNALYVAQGGHFDDPPAMPFRILFSTPVTMVGLDYASSTDSFLRLDAYNPNGTLLESLWYTGQPTAIGLGGFAGIEEASGVSRLDVSYHPVDDPSRTFNFSIDNLQFEPTPEASTLTLLTIGGIGILLGRRRHVRLSRRHSSDFK